MTDRDPIPPDARVALSLKDGVRDLSAEDSRKVLQRYPQLLVEYRKLRGMTRAGGRLIVVDQQLLLDIRAWLEADEVRPL